MKNYCTLFNSDYLTRGLAMYESLESHSNSFHLYVFAFDDKCYELLQTLKYEYMTVISLEDFEDDELLKIKNERTVGEYCWSCTPSTIKYAIDNFGLDSCTYLDADLYFYSDPAILIEEMKDASVLITEHRYTSEYDQSKTSGKYCVQFMTFKNDKKGMEVLNWWRDACIDWCFARFEDGKFGDQKYLDDWTTRFDGVHELQHLGGGVAPWNVQQYDLTDHQFELVFYHFHNFKFLDNDKVDLGTYKLSKDDINILYKPYARHLDRLTKRLNSIDDTKDYNGAIKNGRLHWKNSLRALKRKLSRTYNIFDKDYLLER